ncbi:MAG: LuxR C-terminal-related transcriptional regulator [Gammaproteobacteria bacterium]|nr:LuxR C-terminal-related transcriptional regulator [Gammaproteobacteria bacterium]
MIEHNFIDYVNQAPGLVLIKDKASVIQACSPQWAQLIGYDSPEAVQGITDFEMRCDAVRGAEAFIDQDKDALTRGENRSINIYTYTNGNKIVMYGQKTPLVLDEEVVGINAFAQDLTQLGSLASRFILLLEKDGRFLSVDAKKANTYIFHDTYPDDFLTKKESMCLFYILRGKSNKDISHILNLSCRTVEGKIISIKKKMGCDSRNQLIEHALHKGYLDIIIKELLFCDDISLILD